MSLHLIFKGDQILAEILITITFHKNTGVLIQLVLIHREAQTLWLTAEQKADIASHEADELRQELTRIEERAKKYADKFQVCLFIMWRVFYQSSFCAVCFTKAVFSHNA